MVLRKEKFIDYWESKHNNPKYQHGLLNPMIEGEIRQLNIKTDEFILDHGCGQGRISLILSEYTKNIIINDISISAINITQTKLTKIDTPIHPYSFCSDIYDVLLNEKLNYIVSHRVFHTMPEDQRLKCLDFFYKNLKQNGKLFLSAKSVSCPRLKLLRKNLDFVHLHDSENTFVRSEQFKFVHYFNINELIRDVESVGFKLIKALEFKEATGNKCRAGKTKLNHYILTISEKK